MSQSAYDQYRRRQKGSTPRHHKRHVTEKPQRRGEPFAMTWYWVIDHPKLTAFDLGVCAAIRRSYNHGHYVAKNAHLAKRFRVADSTIRKSVARLKTAGVFQTKRFGWTGLNEFFFADGGIELDDDDDTLPAVGRK